MSKPNIIKVDTEPSKSEYVLVKDAYGSKKKHLIFCYMPEYKTYFTTTYIARHFMPTQVWYDKYILEIDNECQRRKCIQCGNIATFFGVRYGYNKYCSHKCYAASPEGRENNRQSQLKFWSEHPETKIQIGCSLKIWHENNTVSEETRKKLSESLKRINAAKPELRKSVYKSMMQNLSDAELLAYCRSRWSKGGRGIRHKLLITDLQYCDINNCNVQNGYIEVKSNYEYAFVKLFESLHVKWSYEPCVVHIDGIYDGYYVPDFKLHYNNKTFIVECKQSKFLNDNRTIVRQNALEIWCKMHNYIALLLTEHDLQVDVLLTKLV